MVIGLGTYGLSLEGPGLGLESCIDIIWHYPQTQFTTTTAIINLNIKVSKMILHIIFVIFTYT